MDDTSGSDAPKLRILFFDRGKASYIERDIAVLAAKAQITRVSFLARRPIQLVRAWIEQVVACLLHLKDVDLIIVHFAGWGSIVPLSFSRLFKRPSILFLHGAEAVSFPWLGYGNFRKWPLSSVTARSLELATQVVVVDGSLIRSTVPAPDGNSAEQGILHFLPRLTTPVKVIPHGFDPDIWKPSEAQKDIDVLTVGVGFESAAVRRLKGVDRVLEMAKKLPHLCFTIVGWKVGGADALPPNVTVLPKVEQAELISIYQRAKCYAQLSLSEGFGCALVEAMSCGAVPIVNRIGAMPGIVQEHGVIVDAADDDRLVEAMERAISLAANGLGLKVSDHARSTYPNGHRGTRIAGIITELTTPRSTDRA